MAIRTGTPQPDAPPSGGWTAEPGMTISTVRVRQVRDAFVAVEHPTDMAADQLSAALGHRSAELSKCDWWDASTTTAWITLGSTVHN